MSSVSNTEELSPSAEEMRGRGVQEAARVYGDWLGAMAVAGRPTVTEAAPSWVA